MPNANCTPLGQVRRRPPRQEGNNSLGHNSCSITSMPEELIGFFN
jgi:hypothetical protein